jgi:hypothetical protein
MTKAQDLITITTNEDGQKRVELVREEFDKLDSFQKAEFTKLYSEWYLSAREDYNDNIGEDSDEFIYDCCVDGYESDEEFQKAWNTKHTREEFRELYENGDFDEIPELKEMEKHFDEMLLDDIICSDFWNAPFLIATDYYGHASQFVDVVEECISSLWVAPAPEAFLDSSYLFLTEEEQLLDEVNTEAYDNEDREIWIEFAKDLISKFPNVDIEKVYKWVVEELNKPVSAFDDVTIEEGYLELYVGAVTIEEGHLVYDADRETRKYSLAA